MKTANKQQVKPTQVFEQKELSRLQKFLLKVNLGIYKTCRHIPPFNLIISIQDTDYKLLLEYINSISNIIVTIKSLRQQVDILQMALETIAGVKPKYPPPNNSQNIN